MCWSQQLYDAMIHVYNCGMYDFTTPLLELLLQLRGSLKKGKGKAISGERQAILNLSIACYPISLQSADVYLNIGNKLLVYIR